MNALYTTTLYNGDDTEPGYTADLTAYIVGMARLRQLRVKNCRLLNYWKVRQILMHILKKKKTNRSWSKKKERSSTSFKSRLVFKKRSPQCVSGRAR